MVFTWRFFSIEDQRSIIGENSLKDFLNKIRWITCNKSLNIQRDKTFGCKLLQIIGQYRGLIHTCAPITFELQRRALWESSAPFVTSVLKCASHQSCSSISIGLEHQSSSGGERNNVCNANMLEPLPLVSAIFVQASTCTPMRIWVRVWLCPSSSVPRKRAFILGAPGTDPFAAGKLVTIIQVP